MQKIKPLSAVFYVLHLFPGTSLFDEYRQKARLSDRVWLEKREDFLYFELDQKIKEMEENVPSTTPKTVMTLDNMTLSS